MRAQNAWKTILLIVTLTTVTLNLQAQSTFGSVRGNTTDASGAAVPGAVVTLHSVDENTNASTVSDDGGNFVWHPSYEGFQKGTDDNVSEDLCACPLG